MRHKLGVVRPLKKHWFAEVEAAVAVRVNHGDTSLREKAKAAFRYWNAKRRLWVLPLYRVRELGLEERSAQFSKAVTSL